MKHRYPIFTILLLTGVSIASALFFTAPAFADGGDVQEGTFESAGVEIRYQIQGQGDPLVLIHGYTANVEANWVLPGITNKLAEGFQVIALDARGHGKSGKPHDPEAYGVLMAQDVINLMDHLEIEKAHIAGYSMGGFVTLKLLTMAPERFLSAIVGAAGWWREDDEESFAQQEEIAVALEKGEGLTPLFRYLSPEDEPMSEEQLGMMNQMVLAQNDPLALAAAARGFRQLTVTEEQLRNNQVPTLAIIGSRDPLGEYVKPMILVMANLEVQWLEGADHISALLNPAHSELLAQGMIEFLVKLCKCA